MILSIILLIIVFWLLIGVVWREDYIILQYLGFLNLRPNRPNAHLRILYEKKSANVWFKNSKDEM